MEQGTGKIKKPYHDIVAWQKAHEFVLLVYKVTESFPSHEKFGLISQLRRAALSVPTNIVEGSMRGSDKDNVRFLIIAKASLGESEYLLELSHELGYLSDTQYNELEELRRNTGAILHGFLKSKQN